MTLKTPGTDAHFLYSGGLAETVSRPTPLTYSFLSHWFCGARSLGKAMELLGLPHEKITESLVTLHEGDLFVDLAAEERTLYAGTIFGYKNQSDVHSLPSLKICYSRLFSPSRIMHTMQIILYQSQLISDPTKTVEKAKNFISAMPEHAESKSFEEIDVTLTDAIWPYVIAIGAQCEFYSRMIEQEAKNTEELHDILSYVSIHVSPNDWFFTSLSHQDKVRRELLSFDEYISYYGIRSQKDYEIASPRWHEQQDLIQSHIRAGHMPMLDKISPELAVSKKVQSYIDATIRLQILRSEARRRALIWIDALRQATIGKVGTDIAHYTREELLAGVSGKSNPMTMPALERADPVSVDIKTGKGMPVSPGSITGATQLITSSFDDIAPGTIGIFPNASTDFTMLYPKCAGMIFLVGGQTSHGAIVAREFGIPAIVESSAQAIANGTRITLNGGEGVWQIG